MSVLCSGDDGVFRLALCAGIRLDRQPLRRVWQSGVPCEFTARYWEDHAGTESGKRAIMPYECDRV